MAKTDQANPHQAYRIKCLIDNTIGLTLAIKFCEQETPQETAEQWSQSKLPKIEQEINQKMKQALGNCNMFEPPTYSDLRYILRTTLLYCADLLDKEQIA